MLKKVLLLITALFCFFNSNAQVENTIKLGIEAGFLPVTASINLGLLLSVEPKLKVAENTYMGLRIGLVVNPQKFKNHDRLQFEIDNEFDNGGISLVPTLDRYFKERYFKGKFFRPYVGLGLGVYFLTSYVDVISNTSTAKFEVKVNKQPGALFRGGFESGKLRVGLEYNFVLKADIEVPNGQLIGTLDNSYFGLSIGFIIGSE